MTWTHQRQHVVLCEGYDDRDFWLGWLEHLGCTRPGDGGPVTDPWGRAVAGGQLGYRTPGGEFLRVQEVRGREKLADAVREKLADTVRGTNTLLVNLDSDETEPKGVGRADDFLNSLAKEHGYSAVPGRTRLWEKDGRRLGGVVWESRHAVQDGIPQKQTLERLICASIVLTNAASKCGVEVHTWLDRMPQKLGDHEPGPEHKRLLWSFFGKWYVEKGRTYFLQSVWKDAAVAAELESQLRATGAWDVVTEALFSSP